jgi:hypothetical protein
MKIAVCIPFYKFMDALAVQSFIAMMADIHNRGDAYIPVTCHSLYIEKARTMLFKTVLEKVPEADYVLCVDTDHVYSATALYALLDKMNAQNLDMLSAAYVARGMPTLYAHCRLNEAGEMKKIPVGSVSGLVECDAVGFGFLVLRAAYVRRMFEKHGAALFETGANTGGEDLRFCEIAQREGGKVIFDADTKVGHISTIVL